MMFKQRLMLIINWLKDCKHKKLVEGKEKREGEELIQESLKKQKVDDDKETTNLKNLMERILNEEKVAINVIPLAVKSPGIVDLKIYKEGKKSYYQIIRADEKLKMYMFFSQMLESFYREDLEDLYYLLKAKYGSTKGKIVGIKSLLDTVRIIVAYVLVNTSQLELVLLYKEVTTAQVEVSVAQEL
nr:hypothetical protein [Tanacetum cinerariifolium]